MTTRLGNEKLYQRTYHPTLELGTIDHRAAYSSAL